MIRYLGTLTCKLSLQLESDVLASCSDHVLTDAVTYFSPRHHIPRALSQAGRRDKLDHSKALHDERFEHPRHGGLPIVTTQALT